MVPNQPPAAAAATTATTSQTTNESNKKPKNSGEQVDLDREESAPGCKAERKLSERGGV